jgi:hypothetical protein
LSFPSTKTITIFQGQLKWEVIYLSRGQVQILEFECVKNSHIFTKPHVFFHFLILDYKEFSDNLGLGVGLVYVWKPFSQICWCSNQKWFQLFLPSIIREKHYKKKKNLTLYFQTFSCGKKIYQNHQDFHLPNAKVRTLCT